MNLRESVAGKKLIRAKISKIQFPEVCPVCMDTAEDLVFVTIVEKHGPDDYLSSSYTKRDDKTSIALSAARGATTFAVPACLSHGSKSVRSIRTKLIAAIGFFAFLYPIIYFLLQLNVALYFDRPLFPPLMGLSVMILCLVAAVTYGLYPRALERRLKFHEVVRAKDQVILEMANSDYQRQFLELNAMNAELVSNADLLNE